MPKTVGEANIMISKVLDDIIHEEFEEDSQMSSSGVY